MNTPHPLLPLFLDAADGRFPPEDGRVIVLPPLPRGLECSVAFTAHAVVATALPPADVHAQGPDGYGGSLAPDFLRHLTGRDGRIGTTDAVLVARGVPAPPRLPERLDADGHPRVRHARELRTDVRVYGDERGLVTLADGLAGRREVSIELDRSEGPAGTGHGRSLLRDALTLVAAGEPVFAAVSPGNARSLRAFLAAGFRPLGSEVVLRPDGFEGPRPCPWREDSSAYGTGLPRGGARRGGRARAAAPLPLPLCRTTSSAVGGAEAGGSRPGGSGRTVQRPWSAFTLSPKVQSRDPSQLTDQVIRPLSPSWAFHAWATRPGVM